MSQNQDFLQETQTAVLELKKKSTVCWETKNLDVNTNGLGSGPGSFGQLARC